MLNKDQLELQILTVELDTANFERVRAMNGLRPSFTFPVNIVLEGSRWVCSLVTDPDPLKCIVAYGESPDQAMFNFDCLWNGTTEFLADQEEEIEEF